MNKSLLPHITYMIITKVEVLPSLRKKSEVVYTQEHWLYPEELGLFHQFNNEFV